MGKGCCLPVGSDTRRVFVGSSEGLEGWVWGCWQVVGSPVLLIQGTLHSGGSWTTWHARQGCREWRPFYMSPAIACHRCFLSCPFHFPSPAWFSDLLTAFSCLLQPSGWARKRPERIQSSHACPSSLAWLIFCFPSVFSFEENFVLLLCIRLESLSSSSLHFYCF